MQQYTHPGGGVRWCSRGSRRGRRIMRGAKRTAIRATQRRGMPCDPSSPFPRRRWRSPLLLGDVCEDGSRSWGESRRGSGSRRERGERRRGRRKGEERRAVLCLLFLREGDERALASSPISRKCHVGSKSASAVLTVQITKHKRNGNK